MKDVIENKSRLEHGKQVILNDRKMDERDVTLTFTIQGMNESDYIAKYKAFLSEIVSGEILIKVPALGEEVYRMYYLRSASFAINTSRTLSKLSVRFNEYNPSLRS